MTPRKKTGDDAPAEKKTTRRRKSTTATAGEEVAPPEPATVVAEPAEDVTFAEPGMSLADDSAEEPESSSAWIDRMVAFFLGDQRYALPITGVQEIQQIVAFAEVPTVSGSVVGMINMRGAVIPAVDLRTLVGLPRLEYTLETPMIICRNKGRLVALIVDEVQDVLPVPEGCLQSAPAMHALSDRMIGVCRFDTELVYLLDVDRLLAPLQLF